MGWTQAAIAGRVSGRSARRPARDQHRTGDRPSGRLY